MAYRVCIAVALFLWTLCTGHVSLDVRSSAIDLYLETVSGDDARDCLSSSTSCKSLSRAILVATSMSVSSGTYVNFNLGVGKFPLDGGKLNFSVSFIGKGSKLTFLDLTATVSLYESSQMNKLTIIGFDHPDLYAIDCTSTNVESMLFDDVVFSDISSLSLMNFSTSHQDFRFNNVFFKNPTCNYCFQPFYNKTFSFDNVQLIGGNSANGSFFAYLAHDGFVGNVYVKNSLFTHWLSYVGVYSFYSAGGSVNFVAENTSIINNTMELAPALTISGVVNAGPMYVNLTNCVLCYNLPYSFGAVATRKSNYLWVNGGYITKSDFIFNTESSTIISISNSTKQCDQYNMPLISHASPVSVSTIIIAVVVCAAVVIALAFGIFIGVRQYKRRASKNDDSLTLEEVHLAPIALSHSAESRQTESRLLSTGAKEITGVEVSKRLGGGNFGDVYLGDWGGTRVALKKPRDALSLDSLLQEANTLCKVNHPNCVQFLGVFTAGNDKYLVMEYLSRGDLLNVLKQDAATITEDDLIDMCEGAARGLAYLEKNHIIHRDVALRNLLVTVMDGKYMVKVSDFGLSRVADEGTYEPSSSTKIAVKWTSPDVILGGPLTSKNDVWGFGIATWEIFSSGQKPYNWLSNKEASIEIPRGEQLPKPDKCPQYFFDHVMKKCWNLNPEERPTFDEILKAIRLGKAKELPADEIPVEDTNQVDLNASGYSNFNQLNEVDETYNNVKDVKTEVKADTPSESPASYENVL